MASQTALTRCEGDMPLWGESRNSMRRGARARGADLERWVPTFVDLGRVDGLGIVQMNYSFAVASASDLLFYDCDPRLYMKSGISDPFEYARSYIGRVPIESIAAIRAGALDRDLICRSRTRGFWRDLAFNKTVYAVVGASRSTVTMAGLVVVHVTEPDPSRQPRVMFGVPHQGDAEEGVFGFVGELLPGALSTALELASLALEYVRMGTTDERASVNARAVAQGLLHLLRGRVATCDSLEEGVDVPVALGWDRV